MLDPIPEQRLVDLTGAHATTVRRWKRRPALKLPRWLACLVRVCINGELADVHPDWKGWAILQGRLVSPEGWTFTPGAVRAGELYRRQMAEIENRDRAERMALEADPINRLGIQRLAVLQAALDSTTRAMEALTNPLTALERNRLFAEAHTISQGDRNSGRPREQRTPASILSRENVYRFERRPPAQQPATHRSITSVETQRLSSSASSR